MIIVILILTGLFYIPELFTYFVQDDYWLLAITRISTVTGFLNFFKPVPDAVWYRPLSSQVFFFANDTLFGLNPLPFHFVVILTHLLAVYCLYYATQLFTNKKEVAYLAALFYGINQVHTVSLGWLAAYSFILGPLWLLLTLIWYKRGSYKKALAVFILGLVTIEVTSIVPLILVFYEKLYMKKLDLYRLFPYFFLDGLLILFRFIIFPTQLNTSLYQLSLSPQLLSTFKFYILRLLGVPLLFNELTFWWKTSVLAILGILSIFILVGIFKSRSTKDDEGRNILFFGSIGTGGLLPFLLLPFHIAPHYLSFALIGYAPVLALLFMKIKDVLLSRLKTLYVPIIVISFIILQIVGSYWTYQTHWVFRRAILAKRLVAEGKLIHPVGTEEYFSLGANEASKVFGPGQE